MTDQQVYGFAPDWRDQWLDVKSPSVAMETNDLLPEAPQPDPEPEKFRPSLDPEIRLLAKRDEADPPPRPPITTAENARYASIPNEN